MPRSESHPTCGVKAHKVSVGEAGDREGLGFHERMVVRCDFCHHSYYLLCGVGECMWLHGVLGVEALLFSWVLLWRWPGGRWASGIHSDNKRDGSCVENTRVFPTSGFFQLGRKRCYICKRSRQCSSGKGSNLLICLAVSNGDEQCRALHCVLQSICPSPFL